MIKGIKPFIFANFPANLNMKSLSLTYKNKYIKRHDIVSEKSENDSPRLRRWKIVLATGDDFHYQCVFSGGGSLVS
jgi:hypothetical protein